MDNEVKYCSHRGECDDLGILTRHKSLSNKLLTFSFIYHTLSQTLPCHNYVT